MQHDEEETDDGQSEARQRARADLDHLPDAAKEAMKDALSEWLDQKFMLVGKFTVNGFLAAALAALVYAILVHQGWKHT